MLCANTKQGDILVPIRMPDQTAHDIFDTAREAFYKLNKAANLFTVTSVEEEKNMIRSFALRN